MLFHQDNAPSHKSTVAITKLRIGLWIDSSSTLFSGFGPVWLLSVLKLKTWLGGKKFSSNEEVIIAVNEYFADFETAYFKWLPNVNYVFFLAEIWPEEVRRVDLSRCRVIKWIVAPFHGNLLNLSNEHVYFRLILHLPNFPCKLRSNWYKTDACNFDYIF